MVLSTTNQQGLRDKLLVPVERKAIIIHGWGADSRSNWFPWLAREIESRGWQVLVPDFPNTHHPVLEEWLEHLKAVSLKGWRSAGVGADTTLIGHSLGVPLILRFLERLPEAKKVKAAYLVAGFERSLGIPETDNFVNRPFNWERIKKLASKFVVIHSDNDPYIPLAVGRDLARNLGAQFVVESGGGHLNAPGGFLTYPHLLELLLRN